MYSASDEAEFAEPVQLGLMSRQEYSELESLAETDTKAWRAMMIGLVARSVLLYTHFFKQAPNNVIPPHWAEREQEILDSKNLQIAMCVFRGGVKSTIWVQNDIERRCLLSTVPELPEFADPRMLLMQENKDVVEQTITATKTELQFNKKIHAVFGNVSPEGDRKPIEWSRDTIWLRNEGVGTSKEPTLMGVGAGSAVTGFHPFNYYGDDVTTYKSGRTPGMRKIINGWYGTTIRPMKVASVYDVREVWPYTPYFQGELTHLFEQDPNWHKLRIPALNRMPRQEDFEVVEKNGRIVEKRITDAGMDLVSPWPCPLGTGNCPNTAEHYREYGLHRSVEHFIFDHYLSPETGPYRFQLQYMLIRASETDTRFKPEMLRFWTRNAKNAGIGNPWNDLEDAAARYVPYPEGLKTNLKKNVHFWDFAIGKKKSNDRTAGCFGYRLENDDFYVMFNKGRWDPAKALQIMAATAANDKVRQVDRPVVNDANFERTMASLVNAGLLGDVRVKVAEREKKNQDKDTLLQESGLIPHMMAGKVFFEVEDKDAIDEILSFTQGMTHANDDIVDALVGAFEEAFAKKRRFKIGLL